jgi:hypothetical protein
MKGSFQMSVEKRQTRLQANAEAIERWQRKLFRAANELQKLNAQRKRCSAQLSAARSSTAASITFEWLRAETNSTMISRSELGATTMLTLAKAMGDNPSAYSLSQLQDAYTYLARTRSNGGVPGAMGESW